MFRKKEFEDYLWQQLQREYQRLKEVCKLNKVQLRDRLNLVTREDKLHLRLTLNVPLQSRMPGDGKEQQLYKYTLRYLTELTSFRIYSSASQEQWRYVDSDGEIYKNKDTTYSYRLSRRDEASRKNVHIFEEDDNLPKATFVFFGNPLMKIIHGIERKLQLEDSLLSAYLKKMLDEEVSKKSTVGERTMHKSPSTSSTSSSTSTSTSSSHAVSVQREKRTRDESPALVQREGGTQKGASSSSTSRKKQRTLPSQSSASPRASLPPPFIKNVVSTNTEKTATTSRQQRHESTLATLAASRERIAALRRQSLSPAPQASTHSTSTSQARSDTPPAQSALRSPLTILPSERLAESESRQQAPTRVSTAALFQSSSASSSSSTSSVSDPIALSSSSSTSSSSASDPVAQARERYEEALAEKARLKQALVQRYREESASKQRKSNAMRAELARLRQGPGFHETADDEAEQENSSSRRQSNP